MAGEGEPREAPGWSWVLVLPDLITDTSKEDETKDGCPEELQNGWLRMLWEWSLY